MTLRPLRRCLDARDFIHWGLRETRYLLEHALPAGPSFHHKLTLPADSSQDLEVRLRILLMVASTPAGWPSRFLSKTQRDQRLQAIVGSALAPHHGAAPLLVGMPQRTPEAIPRAVHSWLFAFETTPWTKNLDVLLDRDDGDRWWLQLGIAQNAERLLRIPLRSHLLGEQGLRAVLTIGERASQEYLQ